MQDDIRSLLAALRETAEAERADIRARAEQQIAQIRERTETQVKNLRDKALAELENQLQTESECIVGRAKLEIRDRVIHEKNEAIEEVFERASKQIASMDDATIRKETFKRLIEEAIGRIDTEQVRLRVSKADLAIWHSLKAGFPTSVSVESCDGPKGTVIVETRDSAQSIDNSIKTRLEVARAVMRRELVELLFGVQSSGEKGQ